MQDLHTDLRREMTDNVHGGRVAPQGVAAVVVKKAVQVVRRDQQLSHPNSREREGLRRKEGRVHEGGPVSGGGRLLLSLRLGLALVLWGCGMRLVGVHQCFFTPHLVF